MITECILKLIPKPEDSLSVLLSFDSLKAGIEECQKNYSGQFESDMPWNLLSVK